MSVSPVLLKPRAAAAYLGVSLRHFEDLARRGDVHTFFLGEQRLRRCTVEDLDAFIAARRAGVEA